jgi:uncharacterized protein (DUF58 family)
MNEDRIGTTYNRPRPTLAGVLGKALTLVVAAFLAIFAFTVSLIVFAFTLSVGLLAGGYLWWKTRELRRRMREQPPRGRVVEGEAVREPEPGDEARR